MKEIAVGPVSAGERIELLDVLRGFALSGVLLANMTWFTGTTFMPPEVLAERPLALIDGMLEYGLRFFVRDKFITIFAFLFGLGFAVQLIRAEESSTRVERVYVRRLLALLAIGVAHGMLLWEGDILIYYAITGFVLVLFRRASDRTLLRTGLGLIIATPLIVTGGLVQLPPLLTDGAVSPDAFFRRTAQQLNPVMFSAIANGSYMDVVHANIRFFMEAWVRPVGWVSCLLALGKFLLGFLAGRRRYFQQLEQHLPLARRLLLWGLVLGLLGNTVSVLLAVFTQLQVLPRISWWRVVALPFTAIGIPALSLAYVAGLSILFTRRDAWRRRLEWFSPIGRMALTNYLTQSLVGVLLFYGGVGFGLYRLIGTTLYIPLVVGILVAQRHFSVWWLARYRFGPAEWLWRTLTYGARQPMQRSVAAEVAAVA